MPPLPSADHLLESTVTVAAARDRFRAQMDESFKLLVALDHALALGKNAMRQTAAAQPAATVQSGVGAPTAPKVATRPFLMSEAVRVLDGHPRLTAEVVQGLVIQRWYEFLQGAFEALVSEHVSGQRESAALDKFVAAAAKKRRSPAEHFERLPNDEKLPLLARALVTPFEAENVELQRRHIMARNNIEHAGGNLRDRDLAQLGVQSVRLLNDRHEFEEFKAGDALALSAWEALRPIRHLRELADELADAAARGLTAVCLQVDPEKST